MHKSDIVIIGGGIVGLSTAYQILKNYGYPVTVLEKEGAVAEHQTGNNSGVLHSGIYYKPGSLKAENCIRGKALMEQFCDVHQIPYEITGKVIVATNESELPSLDMIYQRGQANGVECKLISSAEVNEHEPHVSCIKGIYVPKAGIVNYRAVSKKLQEQINLLGGEIKLHTKVVGARKERDKIALQTVNGEISADIVINCAGLYSDKMARMLGTTPSVKIVPFRGEYYNLTPQASQLCKTLIYPVPNMNFPFLGVHYTKKIDGSVECGPNAVLAFAREGYKKSDINIPELIESLSYPGFLHIAAKYWREGSYEMLRSFSKPAFVKALQTLIPEIRSEDLSPGGAGVRAQAITVDGKLVDDFLIERHGNIVNVLNVPSPAATSSLNIGSYVGLKLFGAQKRKVSA